MKFNIEGAKERLKLANEYLTFTDAVVYPGDNVDDDAYNRVEELSKVLHTRLRDVKPFITVSASYKLRHIYPFGAIIINGFVDAMVDFDEFAVTRRNTQPMLDSIKTTKNRIDTISDPVLNEFMKRPGITKVLGYIAGIEFLIAEQSY